MLLDVLIWWLKKCERSLLGKRLVVAVIVTKKEGISQSLNHPGSSHPTREKQKEYAQSGRTLQLASRVKL